MCHYSTPQPGRIHRAGNDPTRGALSAAVRTWGKRLGGKLKRLFKSPLMVGVGVGVVIGVAATVVFPQVATLAVNLKAKVTG